jgi:tetratricopeptide (TPR) repeat protein
MFPALLSDFHEKIAVRFLIKGDYLKFLQEIRISLKFSTDLMKKENICFQVCNCFDLIQDEAIISEFILENLEILKKASGETRIILAETCKGLGEKFEYQEKFEFSLQFFHLSLDFQLNLKNFSELKLGKLNISIGNVYFKMNKIQESNFYFNKGSQILLKLSKTSFNLDFYVIIIKKLLNLNRFSEAIIWITYSITLCKKHQLLNRDSYFLYLLLSICYEMTENLQLSERSLLNSIDLLETKPGPISKEESLVYEKLADLYTKQKKLPEALKMLKKAKNLQKSELSQNQSIFWILRKTIRCLLILKNYQKAYKNLLTLKNSSKVLIPSNSPEIFAVDFEIGESLLGLEKIGEATELIKKTLTAAITSLPSSHPYLAYGRDLLLKALSWKSSNCQ